MTDNNKYVAIVDPDEAIRAANEMGKKSEELVDLFDNVKEQMGMVGDEEFKLYFGAGDNSKAQQFRDELDTISADFHLLYEQVDVNASNIIEIADHIKQQG